MAVRNKSLAQLPVIEGSVPEPDDVTGICVFAPRCRWVTDRCRDGSPAEPSRLFPRDYVERGEPETRGNLHSDDTTPHNATLRIIGSAHKHAVARSFVVGGVGFRDDADAFGLQTEGDDLALEIVSDLLERTDGSHVTSPVVFRARDHRGLDGDLQAEDDRRRTRGARAKRRTLS